MKMIRYRKKGIWSKWYKSDSISISDQVEAIETKETMTLREFKIKKIESYKI